MTDRNDSTDRRRRVRPDDDDDLVDSDDDRDTGARVSHGRAARLAARAAKRRRQRESQQQRAAAESSSALALAGEDETYRAFDDPDERSVDDVVAENDDDVDYVTGQAAAEEEEEDGEDLLEHAERDYQAIPALDTYGAEGLDDRDYENLTVDARRAVEQQLARRDRDKAGRNDGFYTLLDDMADEDEEARQARRGAFDRRQLHKDGRGDEDDDDDAADTRGPAADDADDITEGDLDRDDQVNLEAFDVPLREWIAQEQTRREIQRKFRVFLRHYTGPSAVPESRRRRGNGLYEIGRAHV